MQSTKTLIPLDRWYKAISANESQILLLAKQDRLVVYDAFKNFLKPVPCDETGWRLEHVDGEELIS